MNLQEAKNLILQNPGQFYTYALKRPNGIPFYIGKGNCKGFRIEAHTKEALSVKRKNTHKENIIRKILEDGNQIDYEIVLFTRNEEEAFDKEMELISFYGRKDNVSGVLANMTDGGDGVFGQIITEEHKLKTSKAMKGIAKSDETKRKISESHKGVKHSEEARRKISIAHKKENLSQETIGKMSKASMGRVPWNKGTKGLVVSNRKGISRSNEVKQKISSSLMGKPSPRKGIVLSKEIKEKMSDSHKGIVTWNKGKKGIYSAESRMKMSLAKKGIPLSQQHKQDLFKAKIKTLGGNIL